MTGSESWTSNLFGIVPHPASHRVLLRECDDGWALPGTEIVEERHLSPVLAARALRESIGFPIIGCRFARIVTDDARRPREGIFVLDALDPLPVPVPDLSAANWITRDELATLPLAHPDHRDVIDDVLRELETGDLPPFRQPWEQPGWFAEACAWIAGTLESLGREITSPPVQMQWWSLSAVICVGTSGGDLYFKAATKDQPLFGNEPRITAWLGQRLPGRVPALIASDPDAGWMLLEDAGPEVGYEVPLERKIDVFQALGAVQRNTAGRVDELLANGCVDRRPDRLVPQVERLLDDETALAALPEADRRELRRQLPAIEDLCRQLADGPVPPTLIHGDFHLENVASRDRTFTIFDWTDASVAHPFVDMFVIYGERDEAVRNRLRDAYLAVWSDFVPMDRLRELWSLGAVVHALHHAVSYHVILEHIEERARFEVERAVPAFLGSALDALRDRSRR